VSLLLFSHINFAAPIKTKIAIIDTGFCRTSVNNKKITINKIFDATFKVGNLNCPKDFLLLPRFHGENIISIIEKNYKKSDEIELFPISVFDQIGDQKMDYWIKAIEIVEKINPDLVISASGLKISNVDFPKNLKGIWFLSAPRVSPFIKIKDQVFPQNLNYLANVFLFGNYLENNQKDNSLLYFDHIKLFEKDSLENFKGSSFALAMITAKILNICPLTKLEALNICLQKYKVKMADGMSEIK
jgi:hypothetical protein